MAWDRVHAEAEVLEHVLSEDLEELIAARLGNPTSTRTETRSPRPSSRSTRDDVQPGRVQVGAAGRFVRVSDSDPKMLRYLAEHAHRARRLGSRSLGRQPFGGPVFVRFGEREQPLGGELARAMRIDRQRRTMSPPPGAPVPALEGARGRRGSLP